ncbi:hypothetical protein PFICI_04724 [Pestalotiopsis fici W106-1]|uniref:Xylanolytic transcriptional activator regulatory domain-containing protein n=1 Tax=Pestalotiopsis fici (strain W106-1 / CGMCC3.15140) TaxID=1229662 RepID=W3X9R1_PESFW|nr:uncharacterized protein PFICI_04724 [Pestalotiopsis fici W106-1]ETS82848.1 hypothetical protein PFICI_04724 [Pestalotiopsis fici W106-1]
MRQRIDHLEELVKGLINEQQQTQEQERTAVITPQSPEADSTTEPSAAIRNGQDGTSAGQTVIDGNHSVYMGDNDWYTVLQEINELKNTWTQEQESHSHDSPDADLSYTVDGSSLLFNQVKPIERLEILASLPTKAETDRMVANFFDRSNFPINIPPILHEPTFMQEYNEHWKDPTKTGFIWLGLLFSMLGINMLAYDQYGEPSEYEGMAESLFQLYRMRTAQCLLSGDIAKCLPYTVETLRFNATAELSRKEDNRRGLWIMTGVIIRTAINMGYHREPSRSAGFSVLQAEYRRRIWSSVMTMDAMSSFLGGFPPTATAIYSDTREPSNLHDWELSPESTVLPPSRSLEESTSATYLIVKGRLCQALGRLAEFNSAASQGSYEVVLEIDQLLHDRFHGFPSYLMTVPVHKNNMTSSNRADFYRLNLISMYHKGMCTLHRKFMAKARVDERFKLSQQRCISSALSLLGLQDILMPGLYEISQVRQMLTLAAMILILELELRQKLPKAEESPSSEDLFEVLGRSCHFWEAASTSCDEANKSYRFLVDLLSKSPHNIGTASGPLKTMSTQQQVNTSGYTPSFDTITDGLSFGDDLSNIDFDWTMWDTFIEYGHDHVGPG